MNREKFLLLNDIKFYSISSIDSKVKNRYYGAMNFGASRLTKKDSSVAKSLNFDFGFYYYYYWNISHVGRGV